MPAPKFLRPAYYIRRPSRFIYLFLMIIVSLWVLIEFHSKSDEIRILSDKLHRMEDATESLSFKISKLTKNKFNGEDSKLKKKKNTLILGVDENDFYINNGIEIQKSEMEANDLLDDLEKNQASEQKKVLSSLQQKIKNRFWKRRSNEYVQSNNDANVEEGKKLDESRKILKPKKNAGVSKQNEIAEERRKAIKNGMLFAFNSYEKYAWGLDELQPISKDGVNHFGGLGATIIDSLDTLYIMGLNDEFEKARKWVADNLDFDKDYDASVFETIIRVLGGLISAYDLSNDNMFLEKAKNLAERLLPAWNTASKLPYSMLNLKHGNGYSHSWTGGSSILADMGTTTVEMIALSQRVNDDKYAKISEAVIDHLKSITPENGLVPIYISVTSGEATNSLATFGAMGDSYYEYLLKVWVLGGKTSNVSHYREMWEKSMKGLQSLIQYSDPSNYAYIAESHGGSLNRKMDHLACFVPGMLALGTDEKGEKNYMPLAENLMRTCYEFYNSTSSKLSGENYAFQSGIDMHVGYGAEWYILRPETVESLFYLWRKTKNNVYREWGWNIWLAIEKNCKTDAGYTGLRNVNSNPPEKDNMMQSFFLAETMKYLYLLFSPDDVIPLDQWVFNTEAHPIKIIPRN